MEGKTRKIRRPNVSVTPFNWGNRHPGLFFRYFFTELVGMGNRYSETIVLIVCGYGVRIIHRGQFSK